MRKHCLKAVLVILMFMIAAVVPTYLIKCRCNLDEMYLESPTVSISVSDEYSPVFMLLNTIKSSRLEFPDNVTPNQKFALGCWNDSISSGDDEVEVFVAPTALGEGIQYLCIEMHQGVLKRWLRCENIGGTRKYSYGTITGDSTIGLQDQLFYPYRGTMEFPELVGSVDASTKPIEGVIGYAEGK